MESSLKTITVEPKEKHTATVIFMHGLGDSGHGWKPLVDQISRDSSFRHIKWVLPHAPTIPCTANGGRLMPGWYDVLSFSFEGPEDESGILQSRDEMNKLIAQEIKDDVPPNRIVLAGFSQGGAMTLIIGLTTQHKLAGLTVLSGLLPIREKMKEIYLPESSAITAPIFWGHGENDHLVLPSLAKQSKEELEKVGVKETKESGEPGFSFNAYPHLGHAVNAQEIEDWSNWLKKVIPPN